MFYIIFISAWNVINKISTSVFSQFHISVASANVRLKNLGNAKQWTYINNKIQTPGPRISNSIRVESAPVLGTKTGRYVTQDYMEKVHIHLGFLIISKYILLISE